MSTLYDAMAVVGIPAPARAKPTSNGFQRYGKNSRYWLRQLDDVAFFGDHQTGERHTWFADSDKPFDAKQQAERRANLARLRNHQRQEEERAHAEIASRCSLLWDAIRETGNSPYLERKQVAALGIRYHNDCVVIPLYDVAGKLWSLQTIHADGFKRFTTGGKKRSCFHAIGDIGDTVIVGEGYATLASIHMATGATCIVAFDAGNLEPVIEALAQKYPDLTITIAADDDRWKPHIGNIGRIKASEAAKRFGCTVALPWFKDSASKPTDWNDLHVLEGLEAVKSQLQGVLYA